MNRMHNPFDVEDPHLLLPGPPNSWWLPIFGTLQAYCWRAVGEM